MSVIEALYMVGGVIAFFGTFVSILLGIIWRLRNKRYDEQLAQGERNFQQQKEFNSWLRLKINSLDKDVENIKQKIELNGKGG